MQISDIMLFYNIRITLKILYFLGLHDQERKSFLLLVWFCIIYTALITQLILELLMLKENADILGVIDTFMVMTYTSFVSTVQFRWIFKFHFNT